MIKCHCFRGIFRMLCVTYLIMHTQGVVYTCRFMSSVFVLEIIWVHRTHLSIYDWLINEALFKGYLQWRRAPGKQYTPTYQPDSIAERVSSCSNPTVTKTLIFLCCGENKAFPF